MLISVITITRNNLAGLKKTANSIRRQKNRTNLEWIVIDGESNDGTPEYLADAKEVQYWISEKDSGIYDAQNKGLRKAKGSYLLFLNAGDLFANDSVCENLLPYLSDNLSIYFADVVLVDNEGKTSLTNYPESITNRYWSAEKRYICHQGLIFHKDIFAAYGEYDTTFKYAADFEHLARFWNKKGVSKKKLNFPISIYSLDGVSADPSNTGKVLSEYAQIIRKYFSLYDYLLYKSHRIRHFRHIFVRLVNIFSKDSVNKLNFHFSRVLFRILGLFDTTRTSRIRFQFDLKLNNNLKLRVLHLSNDDTRGGAARSAVAVHRTLIGSEFDSLLVSRIKGQKDATILTAPINTSDHGSIKSYDVARANSFSTIDSEVLFSEQKLSYIDIDYVIRKVNPDIVHLHWITNNFISIEDIGKIKKPIVWTMHDMWPFAGGSHIDLQDGFVSGYASANSFSKDREVWQRKKDSWKNLRIFPVGVSSWMANAIQRSALFKDARVTKIWNIVDAKKFPLSDKIETRKRLGLPIKAKIVSFGSDYLDKNKNNQVVLNLIDRFKDEDIVFISFGHRALTERSQNYNHLGYIEEDQKLSAIYSSSDVFLVPSKIESFCYVAAEAISCGTPVVSFDTSGLKDIVIDGITGYRADCYDESQFGSLMLKIFIEGEEKFSRAKLRDFVIEKFSTESIRKEYLDLYRSILN